MAEFYCWPHWMLTALVMVLALGILLQTLVVSYSFRRLRTGWVRGVENGMECTVLAVLLCFAALLARVQYGLFCGFLSPSDYGVARQVVFLMTAVLGTAAAVGAENMQPFFAVGGAVVLLPMTEAIAGAAYPFFFLGSTLLFLLRGGHLFVTRRRELGSKISTVSVKEAIDTMHTGLLCFRPAGEILLCNRRMDALAQQITGKPMQNGREFQKTLQGGELGSGCAREILGGQQVFRLPDSSVWSISTHAISLGSRAVTLLTADDVTEQWDAVTILARQNQALQKRGQELRHTIEHLQSICEAEEIARSKGRVHDLLGQRISLLLRALRDGQQLDEALLMEFVRSLPAAFAQDQTLSPAHAWSCCGKPFRAWMLRWSFKEYCRRMRRSQIALPRSP